jgi:hypothetical protein
VATHAEAGDPIVSEPDQATIGGVSGVAAPVVRPRRGSHSRPRDPGRTRPPPTGWARKNSPQLFWCAVAVVVAVGAELIVAWFMHSKGVNFTGDEPSYIMQAQAYQHLHPQILSTIKADLGSRSFSSAYPPGTPISAVEQFSGPRGIISPFEPGVGLLLVPFVALAHRVFAAVVGMLVLNAAGLVFLHRRMTSLVSLGRRAQVLLAVLLSAPCLLLAVTQIYPDLLSGVLLACAVVEIAIIEQRGTSNRLSSIVITVVAAYLPWLQVKNLLPAIVLLVAFAIVRYRAGSTWPTTVATVVVCIVSWGLLLTYNHLYFGHLLGLPEPRPRVSRTGVEYTLGLLFDRDEGLFVQLPFAVIGLLGLWLARRKLPVAVIATVVSVAGILILNGTYTSNPYGEGSLAGRFMWTALPVLVAWTGVVLARWQTARRLLWAPMVVVAGVWVYQAVPILDGSHSYFTLAPPWDPSSWPGWWPGFDRVLPQFDQVGRYLGTPAIALAVVLAALAIFLLAAGQTGPPHHRAKTSAAAVGVLGVLIVAALVVVKPLAPTTTLSYDAAQVGAPVIGGAQPGASPAVNLQGVLPGTYVLTLAYRLVGPAASGTMVVSCTSSTGAPPQNRATALPLGQRSAQVTIRCHDAGDVATQFQVAAHSELRVQSLHLRSGSA